MKTTNANPSLAQSFTSNIETLSPSSPSLNIENPDAGAGTRRVFKPKHMEWSEQNEDILAEWCDVAQVYKLLHTNANRYYSWLNAWFTIPAIAFSTISGTASFAQGSLSPPLLQYAPMVIGSLNIFIGIITTIQQYLKIAEYNEAHRVSSICWDKFARNIRIELAKKPEERADAEQFIKICRNEFDRLMETSPIVNDTIIPTISANETRYKRHIDTSTSMYPNENEDEYNEIRFELSDLEPSAKTTKSKYTSKHSSMDENEMNI
jgi:hypothetical protein